MSRSLWGVLVGLLLGGGLLAISAWRRARRPLALRARIAPFVPTLATARIAVGEDLDATSAWSTLWALMRPVRPGQDRRARGGASHGRDRGLSRATAGLIGIAVGGLCALLLTHGTASVVGVLLLAGLGCLAGVLLADRAAARSAKRRRERIAHQLPAIADLLAFAVAAGESPLSALDRVAMTAAGDLPDEIRATVADVRSGTPLDVALESLAQRCQAPPVRRFVDGLLIALERGTPIAEVLRAQAADCRADERRALMESAGRKDVLMLVPVVFLVLPTVVLIALYPGIQTFRLVVA